MNWNITFSVFPREVHSGICVAGGDRTIVESPTEPKWSPQGISDSLLSLLEYECGQSPRNKWVYQKSTVDNFWSSVSCTTCGLAEFAQVIVQFPAILYNR